MMETLTTTRSSVYLSPIYAYLYNERSLGLYFRKLLDERQTFGNTGIDGKALWYRNQAIYSFVKADFATFLYKKPPGAKKGLDAEVKLWKSILDLARHMKGYGFWESSPELTLCEIIQESALVLLPIFFSGDNEGKQSTDECIRFYQKQNVMLQDSDALCDNPFDVTKTPWTRDFIDKAMPIANQDKNFRSKYYLPMVRARKTLTAVIKKEKMCSFTEQGSLKRGKKKAKDT